MKKDEESNALKRAVKNAQERRFNQNSDRLNTNLPKSAELERKLEDKEFVKPSSDNDLHPSEVTQSYKDIFPKTAKINDGFFNRSQKSDDGEILNANV